jgi:hypothetical protein
MLFFIHFTLESQTRISLTISFGVIWSTNRPVRLPRKRHSHLTCPLSLNLLVSRNLKHEHLLPFPCINNTNLSGFQISLSLSRETTRKMGNCLRRQSGSVVWAGDDWGSLTSKNPFEDDDDDNAGNVERHRLLGG